MASCQAPCKSINHRREAANKAAGAKKKAGDDDEDADPAAQGPMPPQVVKIYSIHETYLSLLILTLSWKQECRCMQLLLTGLHVNITQLLSYKPA